MCIDTHITTNKQRKDTGRIDAQMLTVFSLCSSYTSNLLTEYFSVLSKCSIMKIFYNKRKTMNTIFKRKEYHNPKCLQDSKTNWENVKMQSMVNSGIPQPQNTMKIKGMHLHTLNEREREREGELNCDLECLHLWGPWRSWNMISSSLIRRELQRNQLTQRHMVSGRVGIVQLCFHQAFIKFLLCAGCQVLSGER